MEQHPVPRNITGFQFHLIGDMTIRQFAYLASGIILAFIVFKVFPLPGGLKFILMGIFGLTGFAFAFLPIQERPLDMWLMAFVKSINSPTQYIWQKNNLPPDILLHAVSNYSKKSPVQIKTHREALDKLHAYLKTMPAPPQQNINLQEKKYISNTLALFGPLLPGKTDTAAKPFYPPPQTVVPKVKPVPVIKTQIPTVQTSPPLPTPSNNSVHLDNQLSQMSEEKNRLMQELLQLKKELQKMRETSSVTPQQSRETPQKTVQEATIKTVNPAKTENEIGILSLPKAPNVIIGAVKDSDRRILPNIIITLKDQKGVPIRALKTNKLGQFASSTALSNGTYLLEVEDPLKRYVFDVAQITLSGKVFLPIEIIAKGEREIMREKLTKDIFGSANI